MPRLIIIAGNGRDSGKTTFACRIIQKFGGMIPLVAVKISPHQHASVPLDVDLQPDAYSIAEEVNTLSSKDSSRMLAGGAKRSFFVTSHDDKLHEVILQIMELAGKESYIICESGGLRKYVKPGIFLLVNRRGRNDIKPESLQLTEYNPVWITFNGKEFDFDMNRIMIRGKRWTVKNT
jgi:hypothetical protein